MSNNVKPLQPRDRAGALVMAASKSAPTSSPLASGLAKRSEARTRDERMAVIYARQDAAERVEAVMSAVLAPFTGDELDRKLVCDAIERRLAELRAELGAE